MSGFWYLTAIAAITGALFSVATNSPAKLPTALNPSSQSVSQLATADLEEDSTDFAEAMELANQAVLAYQSAQKAQDPEQSLTFTRREHLLWQATLEQLNQIPATADSYQQAQTKYQQYQGLLATAQSKLDTADNAFLAAIVSKTISKTRLDPSQVHVSLCEIGAAGIETESAEAGLSERISNRISRINGTQNHCRHYQGNQLMASPASLIKLPIAIALTDKASRKEIPLSQKIYIDPQNFTENAEGIGIEVDQEYSLAQVMTRMLGESNNIATNQLIDYIGREDIAKTMADRGYNDTLVDHKLAGDRILPPNPGTQSNQATTDDITRMMAQIYGLEHSGDEALLIALYSQRDRELGHQALHDLKQNLNADVEWLGEKTGQNDRMIGSTLAMKVGSKRYALTVALDYSSDPITVREIIQAVALHLLEEDGLS